MRLADLSIRRPVFAVVLVAALVALGWSSIGRLGVDLLPRVEFPVVTITTVLEGAAPETIETEVTDVVEEQINTIAGIDQLRSSSEEGVSRVFVEFELDQDIDVKAQDVRDRVALARHRLPVEAEPPIVEKMDPDAAPILAVMVSGSMPALELVRYADDVVKERLERLPGVGSVMRVGGRDREVRIWLDVFRLRGLELAADDVLRAIRAEHAELPGGRLETPSGEYLFKTKGEVESVADFGGLVVAHRAGGPILLRDVARVEDGLEDERSYAELDGEPGVSLLVRRQSGRNTVQVARLVREEVARIEAGAPGGIELRVAHDVSRFIESSIRDVTKDMLLGGVLAVLVTLCFLRSARSTLIVGLAIPTSVVATFFFAYLFGFTVNMLTLMALSISIGILIDDAIVVLENVYRHVESGEEPPRAASVGTGEIGLAVIAATAAIVAVFVPIAFMRGIVGRFFNEYGLTVVLAVSMSLLVALTLTPMLCSRLLRRSRGHGAVFSTLERAFNAVERLYAATLRGALRHRIAVLVLAIAATGAGAWLARAVPLEFMPNSDRSEFTAFLELPLGTGIAETKRVAATVSKRLRQIDGVDFVFATVGSDAGGRVNEASLYVKLRPKEERSLGQLELMRRAREVMAQVVPEARTVGVSHISWVSGGSYSSYPVRYTLLGEDLGELQRLSETVAERMRVAGLYADVHTGFEGGRPEAQATIDRQRAAALGVDVRTLASTLRALVGGVEVATFEEGGERYDVRVRLEQTQRDQIEELGLIQVRARDGRLADLDNVATLREAAGPAQITRQNRTRQVDVLANTASGVPLGTAMAALERIVAEVGLPAGYSGGVEGDADQMQESFDAIVLAFLVALVSLYMILAVEFNSFVQPLVVMITAPLAFIGAFAALWAAGESLSLFAQIGIVILMGLVMKNGILLVDCANQLRDQGVALHEATARAGTLRLRPILMTTVSTVAGMFPVAFSRSDGAEFRNPMGILMIGGLASSMFLTLLVVPVVYTLVVGLMSRLGGRGRRRQAPGSVGAGAQSAVTSDMATAVAGGAAIAPDETGARVGPALAPAVPAEPGRGGADQGPRARPRPLRKSA